MDSAVEMCVLILILMRHIAPKMPIMRTFGCAGTEEPKIRRMIMRGSSMGKKFYRQRGLEGALYSVCLECFLTVGTAEDEVELELQEKEHECQGFPRFQDAPLLH